MNKNKAAGGRIPKKRTAGRPAGSPNVRSGFPKDEKANWFRCTEGFNKVCDMLIAEGHYKSRSDIYHEAVMLLAARKDIDMPGWDFWKSKIM